MCKKRKSRKQKTRVQRRTEFFIDKCRIPKRQARERAKAIEELLETIKTEVAGIYLKNKEGKIKLVYVTLKEYNSDHDQRVVNKTIWFYEYNTGRKIRIQATEKVWVIRVIKNYEL